MKVSLSLFLFFAVFGALLFGQTPNDSVYHEMYISGGYIYGIDTLDSGMTNIPPEIQTTHTIIAKFTLVAPNGTTATFQGSAQGNPINTLQAYAGGSIPAGSIGVYHQDAEDTAWCAYLGELFFNDTGEDSSFTPPPEITGVQNWSTMNNDFAIGESGTMVLYGYSFLCEDSCPDGDVTFEDADVHMIESPEVYDQQINVSYSIDDNAQNGTHTVCYQNIYGQTCGNFFVGDAVPTITSISQSTFDVGVLASGVTVAGQHFGTNCPTLTFPFQAQYSVSNCNDTSFTLSVTPSAAGSGNLTLNAQGYDGQHFDPQMPGGSGSASTPVSAANFSLSIQAPLIYVSTGDTNDTIGVSANPANVPYTPTFSLIGTGNINSTCTSSLAYPAKPPTTGEGTLYVQVTASGGSNSCSGVFNLEAAAYGAHSTESQVVVPPQILIQMLYGEAHAQAIVGDTTSQLAIGVAVQNRFSQPSYFSSVSTWQAAITPSQFNGINYSITNGPEPDLQDAGEVFASASAL